MNNDRLLTRVWDKHAKKMYYENGGHPATLLKDYEGNECDFVSATATGIVVDYCHDLRNNCVIEYLHIIPFKDRFVPMTCAGIKGTNNKLLYQEDIIVSDNRKALIVCDDLGNNDLIFQPFNDDDLGYFHSLSFAECAAIGNRWENEKFLDKLN